MDDAARRRERAARLQARNERRRRKGLPAWESDDAWWVSTEPGAVDGEAALEAPPAGPPLERRRLAVSTAIFGIATGLSRVLGLVRMIDRAVTRGALHRNTAARKKSQAARLVSSAG